MAGMRVIIGYYYLGIYEVRWFTPCSYFEQSHH